MHLIILTLIPSPCQFKNKFLHSTFKLIRNIKIFNISHTNLVFTNIIATDSEICVTNKKKEKHIVVIFYANFIINLTLI